MKKIIKTLLTLFLAVLFIIGFFIEPDKIIVHREILKLKNWDKAHDNIKIAIISDIHAGAPFIGTKKLEKIVELTNKEKPDLILFPGDFVETGVIGGKFIKPVITAGYLSKLQSKYSKVAVLGNHDWWYDGEKVRSALKNEKIAVLENDSTKIIVKGKPLWVAGLADLTTRYPDVEKALNKVKNEKSVLLLSHNPDAFPFVPQKVSLTISGHTHGGQVRFPVVGSLIVPSNFGQKYAFGHVHENNKDLFVSTGLGTSRIPVRFGVSPEISILTIKSK